MASNWPGVAKLAAHPRCYTRVSCTRALHVLAVSTHTSLRFDESKKKTVHKREQVSGPNL